MTHAAVLRCLGSTLSTGIIELRIVRFDPALDAHIIDVTIDKARVVMCGVGTCLSCKLHVCDVSKWD